MGSGESKEEIRAKATAERTLLERQLAAENERHRLERERALEKSKIAQKAEEELQRLTLEKRQRDEKERQEAEKARQESWRKLPPEYKVWNDQSLKTLKERLSMQIQESNVGNAIVRILLVGDTGSGKSSLINSMNAALTGSYSAIAIASAYDHTTKKYVEYPLAKVHGSKLELLPFNICDFRGFGSRDAGASSESVEAALLGLIEDDQKVDANSRLKDFGPNATDDDMLTYIGVVINATLVDVFGTVDEPHQGTFRQIQSAISFGIEHDMPTLVFLTMCDMLDSDVFQNPGRIYYSRKIHKAVVDVQCKLGLDEHQIIPVVNITKDSYIDAANAFQFLYPISFLISEIEGKMRIRLLKKMKKQRH